MADPRIRLLKMAKDGQIATELDQERAEDGGFHAFVLPATSELVYTLPTNSKLHVRTIVIYNGEAGVRSVRLNNAADAQVFPTIECAVNVPTVIGAEQLRGLVFTGNVKAQTDAGAIATGIQIFVGGLLEPTGAEVAE